MPPYRSEWLTGMAWLGDCGHLLLAPRALDEDVCTQPKSSFFFRDPSRFYGWVMGERSLHCAHWGPATPKPLFTGGYTGRSPAFGAEVIAHPLYRYFWAARMGAVDFHPLWLPDSTCGSSYNFFSSLHFWGLAATW